MTWLGNSPTSFEPGNSICMHLASLECRHGGVAKLFGCPKGMDPSPSHRSHPFPCSMVLPCISLMSPMMLLASPGQFAAVPPLTAPQAPGPGSPSYPRPQDPSAHVSGSSQVRATASPGYLKYLLSPSLPGPPHPAWGCRMSHPKWWQCQHSLCASPPCHGDLLRGP